VATRALLGVLLFGGSFAIGLAGTWAWITSTPGGDGAGMAPPLAETTETDESPGQGLIATAIVPTEPAPEEAPVVEARPDPAPTGSLDAPIQAPPTRQPAAAPAPAAPAPAMVAAAAPVNQPAAAIRANNQGSRPGWANLIGKRCMVSLDSVGFRSLSIRQGELASGSLVDWDRDFGQNSRTHLLRAGRDTTVDVLGIGVDPSGLARVAHVRSVKSGKTGVISLLVENKRVPLVILDGDR